MNRTFISYENFCSRLFCFVSVYAFDRLTNRQILIAQPCICMCSRTMKNLPLLFKGAEKSPKYGLDFFIPVTFGMLWFGNRATHLKIKIYIKNILTGLCTLQIWRSSVHLTLKNSSVANWDIANANGSLEASKLWKSTSGQIQDGIQCPNWTNLNCNKLTLLRIVRFH